MSRSPMAKFTSEQAAMLTIFASSGGMPRAPASQRMSSTLPTSDTAPLPRWNPTRRSSTSRGRCATCARSAQV
jgi:hypothetical protein